MAVLQVLASRPGQLVQRSELLAKTWTGGEVYDEALTQCIYQLRQQLTSALGRDAPHELISTVPKRGYCLTAEIKPVEAQPETPGKPASPGPGGKIWPAIGLLLLLSGGWIAVEWGLRSVAQFEPVSGPERSGISSPVTIAVLPFINLGNQAEGDLLAEGIADELVRVLSRNRELRVITRSSAFRFRSANRDLVDIGRILGVRYILEGTVRSSAESMRTHARLVEAGTGIQVWAKSYRQNLTSRLVEQQDLALKIAQALTIVVTGNDISNLAPGATSSVEARREVLRARRQLNTRSVSGAEQAAEYLQRALTLDPGYALAYARLADAVLIQSASAEDMTNARDVASTLLDKALELDPGLGEAYVLRALITDDPGAAERDLRRGLELNPSYARGYELLANLQAMSLNQIDKAIHSIDRAIALDPLSPTNFHTKALLMMDQGFLPESAALERRALELNPQFHAALTQLALIYAEQGQLAEAILYAELAVAQDPRALETRGKLLLLYLALEDMESARDVNTPATALGRLAIFWAERNMWQAASLIYGEQPGSISERFPMPILVSQVVVTKALEDGEFASADELLSSMLPTGESLPPEASGWKLYDYANLVQLLTAGGETRLAERLRKQIEERMDVLESLHSNPEPINDQVRATLLALEGNEEEACAALERSYTPAPRLFWRFVVYNPAFEAMRSTSCFQSVLERINAHVADEKIRVDILRRTGQIPDRTGIVP
jgi:TolB-like protein